MQISKSILALALAAITTGAVAADAESTAPAPSIFVQKAAMGGMTEVEAAKLALSKSQNPEIRSFAQQMVSDHGMANTELAAIAKRKGIEPPSKLDSEHQSMIDSLGSKTGTSFDGAYAQHMNMDHSKAIALFESATGTSDPDLAMFATKTLPTLKAHKTMAEKLPR
jgi:putative membrane protein